MTKPEKLKALRKEFEIADKLCLKLMKIADTATVNFESQKRKTNQLAGKVNDLHNEIKYT